MSDAVGKLVGEGETQLEEGEISEESGAGVKNGDEVSREVTEVSIEEEKSLWLTKHSKNYRRALRQFEYWKASGAV